MRSLLPFFFLLFVSLTFAQKATVISENANLRGTPALNGRIVDVLSKGESLEVIKQNGPWFLVQALEYVGWIHGDTISLNGATRNSSKYAQPPKPQRTEKAETSGGPQFSSVDIGEGLDPTIDIRNDSSKTLNLKFGGVRYKIAPNKNLILTVEPGNYEFNGAAPGVRGVSGVKEFRSGRGYTWTFYIVTIRGEIKILPTPPSLISASLETY